MTLKFELYADCPPTMTENGPEVAPEGTITAMLASLQLAGIALVPFSAIALVPWLVPNPLPLIRTCIPTTPLEDEMLVMVGG